MDHDSWFIEKTRCRVHILCGASGERLCNTCNFQFETHFKWKLIFEKKNDAFLDGPMHDRDWREGKEKTHYTIFPFRLHRSCHDAQLNQPNADMPSKIIVIIIGNLKWWTFFHLRVFRVAPPCRATVSFTLHPFILSLSLSTQSMHKTKLVFWFCVECRVRVKRIERLYSVLLLIFSKYLSVAAPHIHTRTSLWVFSNFHSHILVFCIDP